MRFNCSPTFFSQVRFDFVKVALPLVLFSSGALGQGANPNRSWVQFCLPPFTSLETPLILEPLRHLNSLATTVTLPQYQLSSTESKLLQNAVLSFFTTSVWISDDGLRGQMRWSVQDSLPYYPSFEFNSVVSANQSNPQKILGNQFVINVTAELKDQKAQLGHTPLLECQYSAILIEHPSDPTKNYPLDSLYLRQVSPKRSESNPLAQNPVPAIKTDTSLKMSPGSLQLSSQERTLQIPLCENLRDQKLNVCHQSKYEAIFFDSLSLNYLCRHQDFKVESSSKTKSIPSSSQSHPPVHLQLIPNESAEYSVYALNLPVGGSDQGQWRCGSWAATTQPIRLCALDPISNSCLVTLQGQGNQAQNAAYRIIYLPESHSLEVQTGLGDCKGPNPACQRKNLKSALRSIPL